MRLLLLFPLALALVSCGKGGREKCEGATTTTVPIDLPKAATGAEVAAVLSIDLKSDGTRFVNGRAMKDDAALRDTAKEASKNNPEVHAVINADKDVRYESLIKTIDLLKVAGVSRVAFGVAVPPPQPAPR